MKRYRIIRLSQNSWHMDGTPIIELEHTVLHRSLKAARRELNRLLYSGFQPGTWSARWNGALISEVYPDGNYRFGLDAEDHELLREIGYEEAMRDETQGYSGRPACSRDDHPLRRQRY